MLQFRDTPIKNHMVYLKCMYSGYTYIQFNIILKKDKNILTVIYN